jgi:hypothetical protein
MTLSLLVSRNDPTFTEGSNEENTNSVNNVKMVNADEILGSSRAHSTPNPFRGTQYTKSYVQCRKYTGVFIQSTSAAEKLKVILKRSHNTVHKFDDKTPGDIWPSHLACESYCNFKITKSRSGII